MYLAMNLNLLQEVCRRCALDFVHGFQTHLA